MSVNSQYVIGTDLGPLFDLEEAEKEKNIGISRAMHPQQRQVTIESARAVARQICIEKGSVTTDDVVAYFNRRGVDINGILRNAMGGLFRGSEWRFTGERIKCRRVNSHAREIKIWCLNNCQFLP